MSTIEDLATIKLVESNEEDSPEQRLLQIIGNKFQQKCRIYFRIGARDLLVLNPGEQLPIYDQSVMGQYLPGQQNGQSHIFCVTSQAMKAIVGDGTSKKNEVAIVFGGEAGSGKTVNLFYALRYFAYIDEQRTNVSNIQSPKFDIELANSLQQLLNAFGGAKTLKNDISTRHGYYIELQYSGSAINGIEIESNVPLELSRLIQQKKGERNFACFYQFCSGLSPEQREKCGIKSANNYFYLNQGKCPNLDPNKEAENFVTLCKALSRIGFSEHQQELIFRLMAAILHAGNVFFRAKKVSENDEFDEEYAELANEGEVNWIAHLLDIDFANLKQILTKSSQGDPFTVDAALDRRDWFAKCIYSELFRWIFSRVNSFLRSSTNENSSNLPKSKIMLVDLPGYERYNNNEHEEFCVNLISEQMERFFQEQIFGQFNDEELKNECPGLGQSKWPSNARIMEMLTKRPTGILELLGNECKFPKGSDETFLQHCNINHLDKCPIYSKARMKGKLEMGIRHHFGMAFYSIDGFLQKNYFLQVVAFYQILAKSKDVGLAAIFSQSMERQRENKWIYVANEWWKAIQKLCDKLTNINSFHFVRCIRTNYERIAGKWDPNAVLKQLKALNLLEHCRAVQMAFPHKFSFAFFVRQFKSLLSEDVIRGQSTQQIAKDILVAQGIRFEHDFVFGSQSIFLRDCLFHQLKEMQKFTQNFASIVLQRNVRKFILRRAFLLKKAAIIRIQAGYRGWKERKRVAEMRERQNWMNKFDQQKCVKKIENGNDGIGGGKKSTNISEEALRDFPEELRKIIEKIGRENDVEEQQFRQSAKYISPPKTNIQRPMVPPIKLEHFAMEHFKSIILGCRRDPIETPFLPKESEEEFNKSLELFKLILHYQFQPEGTNSGQLAALAKNIVQQGIDNPTMRDELFAQMLNQTHNCICEYALNRIWALISIAVHAFPPSGLIFPVLYNHFQCQPTRFCRILMSGLLKVSALPETAFPNRIFAPSIIEQEAFIRRQPILLSAQFANGESINVEANSWTTTDEFVQTALRQRGIGDEFGWCLGIDDGKKCAELAATQFPFDAIASFENRRIDVGIWGEQQEEPFAIFDSPKYSNKMGQNENGIGKKLENTILAKKNEEIEKGNNFTQNGLPNGKSTSFNSNSFYRPSFLPPHQMSSRNRNFEFMANSSGQLGHSTSQFSPISSALPFVRHRLDIGGGLQFRRQANPNCMSRITEKDETESNVSTVNRQNTNRAQNIYADQNCLNAIERIKNGEIPKDGQNMDEQYVDNGIHAADYDEELAGQKFDRAIVGKLTASIKGGDFYVPQNQIQIGNGGGGGRRQNPLFIPSRLQQNNQNQETYHSVEPPAQKVMRRFVYSAGGDIMLDNGRQQIPFEPSQPQQTQRPFDFKQIGHKWGPLSPPPQYQPNGEFISPPPFSPTAQTFDQFYDHEKWEQNEPIENSQPTGLRRFIVGNGQSMGSNHEKNDRGLNGIQEHKFEPSEKYQEIFNQKEENQMDVELRSGGEYEGMGYKQEETDSILPAAGNEWMPESEATLDALFNGQQINGQQNNNIYSTSVRPKSNCGSENGFGVDQILENKEKGNKKTALAYTNQPFQLNIRKQIFLSDEALDDASEIDLIFAQIIADCRHSFNQMRIRKYEKESVNQLLRSYNVPPSSLNSPSQISSNIKLELIEIVRKWPLYFCRLFPCIEERPNGDRVALYLGIGETGIRLISITIGGSRNAGMSEGGQQKQMTIQDHFEFSDISDILMERNGKGMRLITRQHIGILLIGPNLAEAKKCIQQYLGMGPKRRQFVIATAEYRTNEQNVLSFEIGDYIQLLDKPDCEPPQSAGTWLYGSLDGRFGWLPGEYVLDANSQEEQLYSASCIGELSESGLTFPCDSIANNSVSLPAIPGVLEPLFTNLDPSALFMPDHMGVERFSMVEFAVRFFRRPKGNPSEKKLNKDFYVGDWSWKEVTDRVKFTDKPIGHSLLRLESHEADKIGQQTFLSIMRFMGDESLKRNQSYTDCVYELLSLCHIYVLIRDEVYCQLLKQITANRSAKNAESGLRGWRLLSILCAYFPCSETLKPFLVKYLGDVAFDIRRTYNALAKLCLFNLAQTYRFGGRRLILGAAEVEAIANGRSVRRQWYNFPGGHQRQICTRSVTVVEEIVQALCLEMNIRGQAEQQEFTLCYLIEKDNSVCTLLNDEYVMDVCTELETRGDEYLLILMRSVWLHPLRRDSELYTDALFFQLMPNYLNGLYVTLREDGSATAATLNDIATLGALLLLSDPFQRHENAENISPTNLAAFVPKTVLQFAGLSVEQWAQRIRAKMGELVQHQGNNSPIGARQRFLEIVERWPLFSAAFYFVKRVFSGKDGNNHPLIGEKVFGQNCILAFNKFGIRILTDETHQIIAEFALDGIREMAKYSVAEANFLEILFSTASAQKHGIDSITVETDLGSEISRLIGHYIFLSKKQ